jgi:hypothetical protein
VTGEALQAGGGGHVHIGGYDIGGRAGWTPVCGDTSARRWFRTGLDIDCPACLHRPTPWTVAVLLDVVDDIADELEREQDEQDLFDRVEQAIERLRLLRGQSTGETDPVARMRAAARMYGPTVPPVNTDECEGCGLPESNCACG